MYLKNKQTQRHKHGYTCISLNLSQDNAVIGVIIMKRNSMYDIRNLEISPKKKKNVKSRNYLNCYNSPPPPKKGKRNNF